MVKIAPFSALRYPSTGKLKDISKFICPPYDVISPEERESLVKKSTQNVVQLELPRGEEQDRYLNAARLLKLWKDEGKLQLDSPPSFYLLETTYKIKDAFAPEKKLKRYGVLTGLRLETPGKGSVKPHEKTLPKAKEDRLNLLKAVQSNISPIFGLFFDEKKEWSKWIAMAVKGSPVAVGCEKKDLDHRMWKISDKNMVQTLKKILSSKDVYIADGHHRYEVAWAYKEGCLKGAPEANLNEGWHYVMTYICPMEEPGLLMLPTHRLVNSSWTLDEWRKHLESIFKIEKVKNWGTIVESLSKKKGKTRTLGWMNKNGSFLLKLKKEISVDRCLAHRPPALKELDVILLHDMGLGEAPGVEILKDKKVIYTRDLAEIQSKVTEDHHWVGFILGSSGVASLARVAKAGEVMPPKTTYFYPKVPTGFTLMPLEQKIS